jgi:hypothetical protein|tara:strand:+ start:871 stop:1146 length:276 start_codon:yes stop_codon:yes gene_type:complete
MKFENLKFSINKFNTGIAALATIDDNLEVSVIAGDCTYSSPGGFGITGTKVTEESQVTSFEVAVLRDGKVDGEVMGWKSRDEITTILQTIN